LADSTPFFIVTILQEMERLNSNNNNNELINPQGDDDSDNISSKIIASACWLGIYTFTFPVNKNYFY
jgi:single-stranded DNA-specific DHH superfamily exonuclease